MITSIIINTILAVTIMLLGIVVVANSYKHRSNIIFFIMLVLLSLFVFVYIPSIFYSALSLFLTRATDSLAFCAACLLLIFSVEYPKKSPNIFFYIYSSIVLLLGVIISLFTLFTPLVVASVVKDGNFSIPKNGFFAEIFFFMLFAIILMSVAIILYKYFKIYNNKIKERHQLKFVLLGCGISIALVSIFFIIISNLSESLISQYGIYFEMSKPFAFIIFVSFTSYGILRGGLFDIRLAIVRSATYSLLIATLAGIYAGSTFAISSIFNFGQSTPAQIISNAAISLILVFLFQPLRKFFDRITSKIFYKDNYSSDEFFGRLNNTLAITTDLTELLERASSEISTTLKSSHAFFYIFSGNDEQHISSGTTNYTDLSNDTATRIKKYITKKPKIIVALLLDEKEELKTILLADKIEIILPLIQDNKIIGFLCLGENMRSNYTDRDIVVLDAISGGLVIAIQNALAVQEIRDFNITLRQRIDEATEELRVKNAMLQELDKAKDEFVSMASHQLRTPLTSVKGYLSMVVDGDAGKVTSQQKELLNQAYTSNERMVDLVNDFLNVSRIQTGKFMLDKKPIDLSKLVDEEVKGLVQNASKRQIKLEYSAPKDFPTIDIDEGKLRQVVMNFIDNAIYYSNVDSTIEIDLAVEDNKAIFTVKDTGIGVPASEQAGLFTKFYRASNAKKQRPDGTGVGLYLAKRIVTDHGGEIIFKTVEGKGSTFGFSLPAPLVSK